MIRFLSTALFSLLLTASAFAQPLHPCAQLVWQDEFDESILDATKWTPQLGDGCDIGLCGWGNNELQYYTDRTANVKVETGNLVITSLKETFSGRNYTSAKLRSINKGDFTFGRVEARIKVPKGAGSWPAFWMLPTDETYGSWPQSGELDIMEYQGKDPNAISGTAHYGDPVPNNKYKGLVYRLPSGQNYYDDFHIFTIQWDSTSIEWYMDGNLYQTLTTKSLLPYHWPFDQRFYIILNNAIGGDLGGPVDDASMPQTMLVDYVRVYSSPLNYRILGNQQLFTNATGEKYYVPSIADATDYQWSVPAGASIVSGQGSNEITVNWGAASSAGNVSLNVVKACGTVNLILPVRLLDDNSCLLTLDDMSGNTNIVYDSWTADNFFESYSNPTLVGNPSTLVGYLEKTTAGTDRFTISQIPIGDYSVYESGERLLYMDIYTNANPGTTFEIRFENKAKAALDYSTSSRTILRSKNAFRRKWETLVFKFDHIENASVSINEIDQMSVVFDPEETITDKYYVFDNFKRGLIPYDEITGDPAPHNCSGSNQTYTATNSTASAYTWTAPTGFTINSGQGTNQINASWSGVISGRFYLQETIAGCSAYSSTLDVNVVACPTSILDGSAHVETLSIYPNPSRDILTVTCDLPAPTDVKLTISSSLGEMMMTKNYAGQSGSFNEQLSIQELKPGSYIIQLVTGSDIRASQLIKY